MSLEIDHMKNGGKREHGDEISSSIRQSISVHIRWLIRSDMREVLEIEHRSFAFPWCEEDFIRCLRQRYEVGMVAEHNGSIVGFMVYALLKNRVHILNIATHPECRRMGVGEAMMGKLISHLIRRERERILVEVRERNLSAQFFFRRCYFRALYVLREFYEDTKEDAYIMQYRFDEDTTGKAMDSWWPRRQFRPSNFEKLLYTLDTIVVA